MPKTLATAAHRLIFTGIAGALAVVVLGGVVLVAQAKREFSVGAQRYTYVIADGNLSEIRVRQDELVRITFAATDIPHSFTIDDYRINRRAEPGKPVVIEFRADKAGQFEFYCSLRNDERCRRETRGRLVVTAR